MTNSYTDVHSIKHSKKILRFNCFFWVFNSTGSLSCYIKLALHISVCFSFLFFVCFSLCSSIFVSLIFGASKELKETQRKHFLFLRMSPLISDSWNLRQYNKWAEIVSSAIKENIMSKGKCSLRVRAVCKSPHNHSPEIFPFFLAAWLCHVRLFLTPWVNCSPPGSSTHGISRQEYWSGLPFPTPGDLLDPGIELESLLHLLHWRRILYHWATREAVAYGIEPWPTGPGIRPLAPALEVRSLNHWTAMEVPFLLFWATAFSVENQIRTYLYWLWFF